MLVVHQAGAVAASLCHLDAILVAQLVGLLHELLHLLHDHLVLLLILLLVGGLLLLRLLLLRLVSWGIVRRLLLLRLLCLIVPGIGDVVAAHRAATLLLLGLACCLFQLFLKFVK